MTEVRTVSSTGGEKGTKPQRYDLMPKAALDAIAEVFAFGSLKYDAHNWRKGYEWSKSYSAAMRHMTAHWDGETTDPESGLPHLAHAGCHVMFMLTWLSEQGEGGQFDDRFAAETIAAKIQAAPSVDAGSPADARSEGIKCQYAACSNILTRADKGYVVCLKCRVKVS